MIRIEVIRGQSPGQFVESSADLVRIGRAEGSELVLADELVSSDHARIENTGVRYVLRDQRSTNGTTLVRGTVRTALDDGNGREATLENGDVIELGSVDRTVTMKVTITEDADNAHVVVMRRI